MVIAGASPRLPLDDRYRGFFELIAAALAAALVMVRAREDERRRAEALAEIDRAKTAFFSNVSHEFRTPLTLMMGPLEESLEHGTDPPELHRQRIDLALRNGRRLLKLVNTLLDFSRIEAGRVQVSYEATDLAAFTAELASNFRSATERAGLALVIDDEPLPELAYVDRDMWEKVILNLLSNAFKFTFAGEIRVRIAPRDAHSALVSVSDTGTGIAAHELPRLFERFHRVEGARGRSFEGSGIGLALVQELVQLHGGTLSVQSTLGIGTTFQIDLPLGSEHLQGKTIRDTQSRSTVTRANVFVEEALKWLPDSPEETGFGLERGTGAEPGAAALLESTASGHVLLADDNADMRGYVRRLLLDQGYSVETVEHGEAALAAARRRVPDLILSDVMMPRLNGFELLDAVRDDAHLKDIPFILLSARAGEEARVEGLQAGADDYLTKPFAARELTARVASAVNRARNRREALLRESETRLRELNADLERRVREISLVRSRTWDLSPELLGVVNARGIFESTNPAWATLLGWSEADLSQTVFSDYLHPDDVAPSWAALDAALQRGQPVFGLENRYRTKHGDYRWVSWVAVPKGDKVYCSARDITDTKLRESELAAAQESLRQTQKIEALGRLTGGVAHDFNNLLQVIAGGLHVIEHADDAALRERVLAGMRQATQRGSALTRQLLAFSRRQALNPQPVNLARHIDGMRELLDRSLRGDVNARIDLPDDLWCVSIDPGELELAILNLCVNSRDAMANGGTIVLSAINASMSEPDGLNGDFVQLSIADTGAGMSDEVMHRLFEPFFTTKDIGKGSGLGLAQVYGFAKQSGGTVRVRSVVGAGTAVTIYLPRSDRQPAEPAKFEESAPQPRVLFRGSLLLVEDDDEVAAFTQEMLVELGFAVTRAASAAAALGALANQRSVDVVFSDIMMPGGMDGVQLARELKRRRPDLPILLTSGHAEAYEAQAEAAGLQILAKPFQLGGLVTAMSRVLKPH
jgi:PAS domain S-box-containing protein